MNIGALCSKAPPGTLPSFPQAEAEKKRQRLQELHAKRKKQVESKRKVRSDKQEERLQELQWVLWGVDVGCCCVVLL